MTILELKAKVKATIAQLGLTKKDVSVSVKLEGYSQTVNVKGKREDLNFKEIQIALEGLSKTDRCEKSGDILEGGNIYVFVSHPSGYTRNWKFA